MTKDDNPSDMFGDFIHKYTRAQAIADGVLVDVTETANESGFRWPVAITSTVWEDCVAWSEEDSERQVHQTESGRLWDVLFMAFAAISKSRNDSVLIYELGRVPRDGKSIKPQVTKLKLVAGPGDTAEPVITIMQIHED